MEETIVFEPIPMERVWGGRRFESLLGKSLPHGTPIGELWEAVDREEAQSVVHKGTLRGKTLHELWTRHRTEIFGAAYISHPSIRFPLLAKLIDARDRLSVQVHPPADLAKSLGGEPKSEAWYVLDALHGARIYAGLKKGTTRKQFEHLIHGGEVACALHEIPLKTGDSIFIPSGRLHAIGEGTLIFEIQQNSDTTYRVFDWNRPGINGQPRALHIEEALASIDFDDFEPQLRHADNPLIAECPFFHLEKTILKSPQDVRPTGRFALVTVVKESVHCAGENFARGQCFIVPAGGKNLLLKPLDATAEILVTTLPS